MLTGSGIYTIDAKRRMALPKSMRAELEDHIYLSHGFESDSIALFPSEYIQRLRDKIATMPFAEAHRLMKEFFPSIERVVIDQQGRILIPDELMRDAGMQPSEAVRIEGYADYATISKIKDKPAPRNLLDIFTEFDI